MKPYQIYPKVWVKPVEHLYADSDGNRWGGIVKIVEVNYKYLIYADVGSHMFHVDVDPFNTLGDATRFITSWVRRCRRHGSPWPPGIEKLRVRYG